MKYNVFDKPDDNRETVLSHSAQEEIISNAKTKSTGTLQGARSSMPSSTAIL